MAFQFGKQTSGKARPSYLYAIIGVALVLFMLGLLGIIVVNAKKLSDFFKENIEVSIILMNDCKSDQALLIKSKLEEKQWVKSSEYISKDLALARFKKQSGEDFLELLEYNPLYASVNLHLKSEFANVEGIHAIENMFQGNKLVKEIYYQKQVVEMMNQNARKISLVLIVIIALLFLIAVALIDNTIKLVMYSNRFLIKSMQMVGATRWFIARPFVLRSVVNGLVSGTLAVLLLIGMGIYTNNIIPELSALMEPASIAGLLLLVIVIGIVISGLSTYRSVNKYLKLKLDDLY